MTSSSAPRPIAGAWVFLLAGTASLAAQQWFTLWLIARTASPETVGAYGLAQAWVLPTYALAGLQLRALMATETDLPRTGQRYLRLRAATMLLGLMYAGALLLGTPSSLGSGALAASLGAARIVEMGSDFTDGLRHAAREYFGIGLSQFCRAAASVAGFSALWFSTSTLTSALLAGCMAALLSALLLDLPRLRALGPLSQSGISGPQDPLFPTAAVSARGDWAGHLALLVHALPLALVQFLNLGILYMPRIFLAGQGSLDAVASYTCLTTMVGLVSLAAGSYAASLAPDFAAAGPAARSRLLSSAVRHIGLGVLPVAAVLAWFGPEVLGLVFGNEIAFPAAAVAWMAVFAVLWSVATPFGTRATAERHTLLQLVAFGAALLVGSLACAMLVPHFDVAGAAFGLVLSAITLLAVYSLGQNFIPVLHLRCGPASPSVHLQSTAPCRTTLP